MNMKKTIINKHDNCQPIINWGRTNAQGMPALCCSTCRTVKKDSIGRVKSSRLAWIDWISKDKLPILRDMCVQEITSEMADVIEQVKPVHHISQDLLKNQ
jgi:hypothetical protein